MTGHCSTCGDTGGCGCNLSPSSDATVERIARPFMADELAEVGRMIAADDMRSGIAPLDPLVARAITAAHLSGQREGLETAIFAASLSPYDTRGSAIEAMRTQKLRVCAIAGGNADYAIEALMQQYEQKLDAARSALRALSPRQSKEEGCA